MLCPLCLSRRDEHSLPRAAGPWSPSSLQRRRQRNKEGSHGESIRRGLACEKEAHHDRPGHCGWDPHEQIIDTPAVDLETTMMHEILLGQRYLPAAFTWDLKSSCMPGRADSLTIRRT